MPSAAATLDLDLEEAQPPAASSETPTAEDWAIHGQATNVWLLQPAFRSPYQGPQSLSPASNARETIDVTLYGGGSAVARSRTLGRSGDGPGVLGLSDTFGVAGYPQQVRRTRWEGSDPYLLIQRAFLRQTVGLGGDTEKLDPRPQPTWPQPDRQPAGAYPRQILGCRYLRYQQIRPRPSQRLLQLVDYRSRRVRLCRKQLGLQLRRHDGMVSGLVDDSGRRFRSI